MAPSIFDPVFYGISDLEITDYEDAFRFRIYFPSLDGSPMTAPILEGNYPLVVFIHGNRTGTEQETLCPRETADDYKRWAAALILLARCGFIVACPDVSGTISSDPDTSIPLIERVIDYVKTEWEGRANLMISRNENELVMGVAGHSWGANTGLRLALRPDVQALTGISGTWEASAGVDFRMLDKPILFVSGIDDLDWLAGARNQPYPARKSPKHQAAIDNLGHWGWFRKGEIYPCNDEAPYPCEAGAHILSELLVAFFTRYLYKVEAIVPFLLEGAGSPPERGSLSYLNGGDCAALIRFRVREGWSILHWFGQILTPNHLSWGRASHPWWRWFGRWVRYDEVVVGSWSSSDPW
jgi:pimeloyl-ACP methyl ester carboxylesterase